MICNYMTQQLQSWKKIPRGSKITLSQDSTLKSFNGELRQIPKGTYYITGFWVDICGLATSQQKARQQSNDYCIQSQELSAFNEVI